MGAIEVIQSNSDWVREQPITDAVSKKVAKCQVPRAKQTAGLGHILLLLVFCGYFKMFLQIAMCSVTILTCACFWKKQK